MDKSKAIAKRHKNEEALAEHLMNILSDKPRPMPGGGAPFSVWLPHVVRAAYKDLASRRGTTVSRLLQQLIADDLAMSTEVITSVKYRRISGQ